MNSRNFSEQKLLDAIKNSGGILLEVARKLNCDRETVVRHFKKHPSTYKAMEMERENFLDIAEAQAYKRIKEGNDTILIFFLKTKGKNRGNTERQEVQHDLSGINIKVIEAKRKVRE